MCFYSSFLTGIGRCQSVRFLVEYKERWRDVIQAHPLKEWLIAAYKKRYSELQAEADRIETERVEREKWTPKGRK